MGKTLSDRVNFWAAVILIGGSIAATFQYIQNIGFIATSTAKDLDEHKTAAAKRGENIQNELHDLNGTVQEIRESQARIEGALDIHSKGM